MKTKGADILYNFDEEINRRETMSIKWDMLESNFGRDDLLSMWVADSDFKCPPAVVERLTKRAEHGIFGYTGYGDEFYNAFIQWTEKRHQVSIEKEWLSPTPGVVAGINFAIQSFTKPGDKIIIQTPVYPPFYHSVKNNDRILLENPLIEKDKTYVMDYDHLESLIDKDTKMLILCNPHNPIGRVWTKKELKRLSQICMKNKILVLSDEIHSDLILPNYKHTPFMSVDDAFSDYVISCFAPSKTFNVAGLATSIMVIPNPELKKKFELFKESIGVNHNTTFGVEAFIACYEEGEDWLEEQLHYIQANIDYIKDALEKELPQLEAFHMEGTYLMWLDCRKLDMDQEALQKFFVENVKVALNSGAIFGTAGNGFMRVNLATTRENVKQFISQLKAAL